MGRDLNFGDRVRVVGGPWPERVGLEAIVIRPTKIYPQPSKSEVLLLVLGDVHRLNHLDDEARTPWSCVMARKDVRHIPSEEPEHG